MDARRLGEWREALWRLAYPEQCLLCGRLPALGERYLCGPCRQKLPWVESPTCPRCGAPVGVDAVVARHCAACWSRHFAFTRAAAPFRYEGAIRDLLLRFKLGPEPWLAHPLGTWLADYLGHDGLSRRVDAIIPVPLHWRRRVARGFNQARLLAQEVGRRLQRPVLRQSLRRVRPTTTQTAFSRLRRESNVRDAFAAWTPVSRRTAARRWWNRLRGRVDLAGMTVLLLDDILTTGSTVHECARVLRRGGVHEVLVATVARATR